MNIVFFCIDSVCANAVLLRACSCVCTCVFIVFPCVLTGEAVKDEIEVEPDKSASVDLTKTAVIAGQKAVNVAPWTESRSVRSKRRVSGEGKPAHVRFCPVLGFIQG